MDTSFVKIDSVIYFLDNLRTHLKNVDQGSGQGAVRRKSGAYTLVCEHFEPSRNTALGP
jgi:hypothetical protein